MHLKQMALYVIFIFPVLGAHYFGIDSDVFSVASAIVSVIFWVFFITQFSAIVAGKKLRLTVRLILFTLLGLYCSSQFISYYLQGSYFNDQFFFHLNIASLTETWQVYSPLFFLFVGWLCCVWLIVALTQWEARQNGLRVFSMVLLLVAAIGFDPGLRNFVLSAIEASSTLHLQSNDIESMDWERLRLNEDALQKLDKKAVPGKNLVLVFLEGIESLYMDEGVFPGLTPHINELSTQGWRLENLNQVKGSSWTMGGLVSSLCGTPLLHNWEMGDNIIMFSEFLNRANCLPDVLNSAGYNQTFMGGASLAFGGKGAFLSQHSFDQVLGRYDLAERLSDPSYLGGWGLYDESLFDLAIDEFDRLSRKVEPFHLMLLTVDTHHPAGEPSLSCPRYAASDNSILQAVHCTDFLVGRFVERLRQHHAYSDTLVVLLSDHLAMRNNAFPLFPDNYERRLYFNVLNSELKGSFDALATPMDIAPTVLSLLDVQHDTNFIAGEDLVSLVGDSREFDLNDAQRIAALRYINSNYLTAKRSSRNRSILIDKEAITFANQIENAIVSKGALTFTVTGGDPHFILPKIKGSSAGGAHLVIDIDVPADSNMAVYYATTEDPNYSENRVRSQNTQAGSNELTFPLPEDADLDRIRVDPGLVKGRYIIRSIEFRF